MTKGRSIPGDVEVSVRIANTLKPMKLPTSCVTTLFVVVQLYSLRQCCGCGQRSQFQIPTNCGNIKQTPTKFKPLIPIWCGQKRSWSREVLNVYLERFLCQLSFQHGSLAILGKRDREGRWSGTS